MRKIIHLLQAVEIREYLHIHGDDNKVTGRDEQRSKPRYNVTAC